MGHASGDLLERNHIGGERTMSDSVRLECLSCNKAIRVPASDVPTNLQADEALEWYCPWCEQQSHVALAEQAPISQLGEEVKTS